MRIRTVAGLAVAAAAAITGGGVAYAAADDGEPVVRIVEQEAQPDEDCPERDQGL
jgi:hypothetical protein